MSNVLPPSAVRQELGGGESEKSFLVRVCLRESLNPLIAGTRKAALTSFS
jgi:hypothetical protein